MKSVQNARQRMLQFPKALTACASQASAYAKCVTAKENVNKLDCQKEFSAFAECAKNAMKK